MVEFSITSSAVPRLSTLSTSASSAIALASSSDPRSRKLGLFLPVTDEIRTCGCAFANLITICAISASMLAIAVNHFAEWILISSWPICSSLLKDMMRSRFNSTLNAHGTLWGPSMPRTVPALATAPLTKSGSANIPKIKSTRRYKRRGESRRVRPIIPVCTPCVYAGLVQNQRQFTASRERPLRGDHFRTIKARSAPFAVGSVRHLRDLARRRRLCTESSSTDLA